MRSALVAALLSCADAPFRTRTRRFLQGLSSDELQFLAGFLGACILESVRRAPSSRAQLAERIAEFHPRPTADEDHKMILLLEFLCRTSLQQLKLPAGQVS